MTNKATEDLNILIAEDDKTNQILIKLLLDKLGISSYTIVENGELAVEKVQSNQFDVILMDIQMPIMNGYEATKRVCSLLEPASRPRIIGLSASSEENEISLAMNSGMDSYILKPINIAKLTDEFKKL